MAEFLPRDYSKFGRYQGIYCKLYDRYFEMPLSEIDRKCSAIFAELERDFIKGWEWHECLSFIEFILQHTDNSKSYDETYTVPRLNRILEEQGVGFRMMGFMIVPIVEPDQVEAIRLMSSNPSVSEGSKRHIANALSELRPNGPIDQGAVVREAISAVEAQAQVVASTPNASLGVALESLNRQKPLHPALKKALGQLYGYTSDEKGVRHAAEGWDTNVSTEDAIFMVIACSAFVSWLAAQNQPK